MNEIEVTYTVLGFEEAGETSFYTEVSDRIYDKLQDAEDDGGYLDSYYIAEEMPGIHRIILGRIRENMAEEGLDPDDGKIERHTLLGGGDKEDCFEASHSLMHGLADDDDIEYTIMLF